MLDSQRADEQLTEFFNTEQITRNSSLNNKEQRGTPPTILEYIIFFYVIGMYNQFAYVLILIFNSFESPSTFCVVKKNSLIFGLYSYNTNILITQKS